MKRVVNLTLTIVLRKIPKPSGPVLYTSALFNIDPDIDSTVKTYLNILNGRRSIPELGVTQFIQAFKRLSDRTAHGLYG